MSSKFVRSMVAVAVGGSLVASLAVNVGAAGRRPRGAVAQMTDAAGNSVGRVRLIPREDGKVTVRVAAAGLTAGFHGFHVHSVGVCDPNATDAGGNPSPFFTAGGHYNPDTTTHQDHAGDMPVLLVTEDGTARLKFVTDRFSVRELLRGDEDGSAIIIHAAPDNLANIPTRYHSHTPDETSTVFGPDAATLATGDAGARTACGVVEKFQG